MWESRCVSVKYTWSSHRILRERWSLRLDLETKELLELKAVQFMQLCIYSSHKKHHSVYTFLCISIVYASLKYIEENQHNRTQQQNSEREKQNPRNHWTYGNGSSIRKLGENRRKRNYGRTAWVNPRYLQSKNRI